MEEGDSMMELLWQSYTERESKFWSWERELLATIAELVHTLIRQNAMIWGAKKHDVPEPLVIPRPRQGDPAEKKEPIPTVSMREFLIGMQQGG